MILQTEEEVLSPEETPEGEGEEGEDIEIDDAADAIEETI